MDRLIQKGTPIKMLVNLNLIILDTMEPIIPDIVWICAKQWFTRKEDKKEEESYAWALL